jgi:hypothetical protein
MTTRLRFGVCLAAVCVAAVSARPVFGQDVTLRYRWTPGEEFRYRMTLQTGTTVSGTGLPGLGDMSLDQTMSQVIRTIVDNVAADGTATLRQVIESVRAEMNTPTGKVVFDSATSGSDAAADPFSKSLAVMYSTMIEQSVTVVTLPTGAVQKIEGMARLMEKMLSNLPQNPAAAGVLDSLKDMFSDDATRDMSSRGLAQFPDRPLKPGDTWDRQFTASLPMTGAITTSTTSTFQGVGNSGGVSVARITAKLTMKSGPAAAQPSTPPFPFTLQMGEGTGESELLFDVARGRVQRVTSGTTQPMTMTTTGAAPDGSRAMSMRTIAKTTMTMELIER